MVFVENKSVFAKMDSLELIANTQHASMSVVPRVFAIKEFAFVLMDSVELIAHKKHAQMYFIISLSEL
jgi:hypothetical protein